MRLQGCALSLGLLLPLAAAPASASPAPDDEGGDAPPPAAEADAEASAAEPPPHDEPQGTPGEAGRGPGFGFDLTEGATYRDPEVPVRLHLGALLALDYRHYDRRNHRDRGAWLDRALLRADGRLWDRLSFRLAVDLIGIDSDYGLDEAWVSLEAAGRLLRLTLGVQEIELGIEHSLPEERLAFVDYGFPATKTGRTDLALVVDGEVAEGLLSYQVGLASGAGAFDDWGQRFAGPEVSARLVSYPFRWLDDEVVVGPYALRLLSGLFGSAAVSYGVDWAGHLDQRTSLRNRVFTVGRLRTGGRLYTHLGYGFDLGPVRLIHEFARGTLLDVELPSGQTEDLRQKMSAWAASLSVMITGEPYDSRPCRQRDAPAFPARPLLPGPGEEAGWGALEVAVRYANTEGDRTFFDEGLTSFVQSSQEARTVDVALNWYPVRTVRLTAQLTRVIADQYPSDFDSHGRDTSGVVRLQLDF